MPVEKFRLAILASGNGSNAEAIMRYFKQHQSIEVALILSNNPKAMVLERAAKFEVPTRVFTKEELYKSEIVLHWLQEFQVTHVVLAGFLLLVPGYLITAFPDKIINIHPALLPKYGGKGMYGSRVHEAVKAANEKETGITIHVVDENYDEGDIVFQAKCAIGPEDTAKEIGARVQHLEYEHYPKAIERWVLGA